MAIRAKVEEPSNGLRSTSNYSLYVVRTIHKVIQKRSRTVPGSAGEWGIRITAAWKAVEGIFAPLFPRSPPALSLLTWS